MNNQTKYFLAFMAGSLAGGGVVWALIKEVVRREADEDIANVRAWAAAQIEDAYNEYQDDLVRITKEFNHEEDGIEEGPAPVVEPMKNGAGVSYIPETGHVVPTDYSSISKTYSTADQKKDIATVMRERRIIKSFEEAHPEDDMPVEPKSDNGGIEIISAEDFFNSENHHEKLTLSYYESDNVLTDEHDGPVPNPDEIVGPLALVSFGKDSDDSNVVYVRNNNTAIDFEIVRSYSSFSEVVLGIESTPRITKSVPKVKRLKKAVADGEE
jgi:hypothetical protein